jgi:hypothetical protein
MTTDKPNKPDPLLWAARKERAKRWLHTDLKGYPTVSDEEETEETLAASPKEEQIRRPKPPEQSGK